MENLGKKLEEARIREGISLTEAAEATKIRETFLQKMESNSFDFGLPEIYRRGFLKIYARYLKLDADEVIREYERMGYSDARFIEQRESFRQLSTSASLRRPGVIGRNNQPKRGGGREEEEEEFDEEEDPFDYDESNPNSGLTRTVILTFGVVIVLLGLLVLSSFWGEEEGDPDDLAPPLTEEVSLEATGYVTIIGTQLEPRKELFNMRLEPGERHSFTRQGPVSLQWTEGENLLLYREGMQEPLKPQTGGPGKFRLD